MSLCRFFILMDQFVVSRFSGTEHLLIEDKLSSRQQLEFIRSEGKTEVLCLNWVLRGSMHMLRTCEKLYGELVLA